MEKIPEKEQDESIRSFESSLHKMEKALAQMTRKGTNTALLTKRLKALQIGLAVLQYSWLQTPYGYTRQEITEARGTLSDLMPSLGASLVKAKEGSPQKTLLMRRIKAIQLALDAMDEQEQD